MDKYRINKLATHSRYTPLTKFSKSDRMVKNLEVRKNMKTFTIEEVKRRLLRGSGGSPEKYWNLGNLCDLAIIEFIEDFYNHVCSLTGLSREHIIICGMMRDWARYKLNHNTWGDNSNIRLEMTFEVVKFESKNHFKLIPPDFVISLRGKKIPRDKADERMIVLFPQIPARLFEGRCWNDYVICRRNGTVIRAAKVSNTDPRTETNYFLFEGKTLENYLFASDFELGDRISVQTFKWDTESDFIKYAAQFA